MGKVKRALGRLRFILLTLILLSWQVVFAGAPFLGTAHAATLASTDVAISSKAFGVSPQSSYSVVNGQPTGGGSISNGNVGSYPEGACIPVLFDVTNNSTSAGDTTVSPVFDYYGSGVVGIKNYELITYNGSGNPETTATNLNQFNYSGQALSAATSFKTTSGATVSAIVSGPYAGEDASTTGISGTDAFRHYNVQLTGIPAGATVQVLSCGRLGLDASQYPGSSLSFRTVQGGKENLAIPVSQILVLPSITVTKTVASGTALPSSFSFTISPDPNNGLGTTYTIPSGQSSVTIPNVNPDGTYTITESGPSGYTFTSGTGTNCSAVAASVGTAAGQMSATVAAAKNPTNATCTFTNDVQKGSIAIVKDAIPNSSTSFPFTASSSNGGSTVSNFSLTDDGTSANTKTMSNLLPGTYTFTESNAVTGWNFDNISCSQGSTVQKSGATVTITLSAGQNVTCTYTNREHGQIIVKKTTVPASDATAFSVTASGGGTIYSNTTQSFSTSSDATFEVAQNDSNTAYSLTEASKDGWSQTGSSCTNNQTLSSIVINGSTPLINGVPTITCTITNTKLAKLNIVKDTNPDGSSQSFSFSATGPSITQNNNAFILDTNSSDNTYPNNNQYSNLTPGTYTITETEPNSSWFLSDLACTGISYIWDGSTKTLSLNIPAGADITCTFTNTEYGSISGYKYEVNADGSHVDVLSGWTITLKDNGGNVVGTTQTGGDGSFVFSGLLAGSYTIWETLQSGWTQIFSPSGVNLTAGQTSTDNNFGNFKNASISGYKFNDVNGNGTWDNTEPGLQGWTITLYDNGGSGSLLNHQVDQKITAANGSYSFTNLPPTNYKVCETQQSGWTQTYPDNTGCQLVTVALSGHDYSNTNFGNQGRGTIQVKKNLDDGFGNISYNVNTWKYDIDGSGSYQTGSSQGLAAGDYTISEEGQADYHFTSVSCTDNGQSVPVNQDVSFSITASPGSDIVCTYTNTRDTGTITVIKDLDPGTDTGKFDLQIDGVTKASDVGNNGTTGAITVTTGLHNVDEIAGTNTSLSHYESSYVCMNGRQTIASGNATLSDLFSVGYGDNIVCTFTNERHSTITVIKNVDDGFGNVSQDVSTWTWGYDGASFDDHIQTGSANTQEVVAGDYSIWENSQQNYHFTSVSCSDDSGSVGVDNLSQFDVSLDPGENLTCTYLNTHDTGTITVHKSLYPSADSGLFNLNINGPTSYTATDQGDNGTTGTQTVLTGSYMVSETAGTNTSLDGYNSRYDCWSQNGEHFTFGPSGSATTSDSFTISNGDNMECWFTNIRLGTLTGTKFNDYNKNGKQDTGEPGLKDWTIQLYECQQNIVTLSLSTNNQSSDCTSPALLATTTTDTNGNYSFNNLQDGDYRVCEVQQNGWTQTFPADNNGCTDFTINLDLEIGKPGQVVTANFGNVKKVKPVVLAAKTELVNTGVNALATIFAGLAMLGLLGAVTRAAKKQ